ncbi:MAG: hypothetical protein JXD23_10695 [Spirochaetales bacterium]|nr:hypothetical protein [Spirochaetales bacterium]
MVKRFIVAIPAILLSLSCAPGGAGGRVYFASAPQKAVIYSDGEIVLEDRLEADRLVEDTVFLPESLDLKTVSVTQDGKRVKYFTIERRSATVRQKNAEPASAEGYLLTFPQYDRKGEIVLRYSVNGVTWRPRLDVEIKDDRSLEMYLNAIISPGENELKDCQLTLVYANSAFRTAGAAERYDIGKIDLVKNRTAYYILSSTSVEYALYYRWDVDRDDAVKQVVAFDNPLPASVDSLPYMLISDNVVVGQGDIDRLQPRAKVELACGGEKSLKTYRKVATKEDTAKKFLAFNHDLLYRVSNALDGDVLVRVYYTKRIGEVHRNVYRFRTKPSARPGEFFVWDLTVPKGDAREISFNFDSDEKNVQEYLRYDDFEGGR